MATQVDLPSREELDAIAVLITGAPFDRQPGPFEKARILELALMRDVSINVNNMAVDVETIARWFEKSRLWEGHTI